jgi:hypothetical protein
MSVPWTVRPDRDEYAEYFGRYVDPVPDGDVLETLEREGERLVSLLRELPAARSTHAYEPGKWSVRDVVAHVSDSERVFSYRALRFGRSDPTPLASFDQEVFWPHAHADKRRWADLIDEFRTVRAASLHLFRSFEPEDWLRRGVASEKEISVRALAWVTAGHELHHRRILRERYGVG